ncbi:vascular endothelial growth factor A-like [Penaeus monodon]|uniref:vascular endothelial growth factor A-like n=1 Tax=Penaeus monodon TaxID=6687 RepID=UPI0018A7B5F2|nr:vascular endothelial growth factor A-like [Penaeus monodon]
MIRWRLIVVSCFLLGDPSTQSSPTNVGDDSRLLPVSVSQEWPLETMLKVTAKKELREFVMNFLLDERMCSSKALFEVVVGEDSTDLAGYQWWSRQCGSKKDFALLGFPDFTDITWARERRDANKGGAKRYYGLSSKEWRKLEKLIKKMCCKAVKTMVELPTEGDSRVQLKPSCVAVRRCSGCCDSRLFECRPTEISVKTFKVIALGGSENARKVRVDEHKACECSCREREEHCNKTIHFYDAGACSCKCRSEMTNCSNGKVWDEKQCACACKKERTCREGRSFDSNSCRCLRT